MQTLWSRVAQAQSTCRCRVCLHPPNALARRSTVAASKRRVTGADLFTACYTTILGTAVVIDSKRKEVRRQELDEKLQKARASLSTLAVQEAPNVSQEHGIQPSQPQGSGHETGIESKGDTELRDLSELLEELAQMATTAIPHWPQPAPHIDMVDWPKILQAVEDEEREAIRVRDPKTEEQMERITQTVEALVRRLLWQVRVPSNAGQPIESRPQGDEQLKEAEQLLGHYPSYENPYIDLEATKKTRSELNNAMRSIFKRDANAHEAVGSICYNLLVSAVPPNILNWNTLITGFHRIQRPDLAQVVVESYLDETRWPATESTMVALLSHAMATNNLDLFRETVGRMRGTMEDGLHLRIVDKNRKLDDRGREWARLKAASRKHAYVQRAFRSQAVFDTLITGWLHFGEVQGAVRALASSVRFRRYASIDLIHRLLSEVVGTMNQNGARALIRRLAGYADNVGSLLRYIMFQATAEMAQQIGELFAALLELSGLADDPSKDSPWSQITHFLRIYQNHVTPAEVAPNGKLQSAAMVGKLAHQCRRLELKTERIRARVTALVVKQRTGYDLNFQDRLPPVDLRQDQPYAPYKEVFHAVQAIKLSKDLQTTDDIKSQLVAGLPNQTLARKLQAFGHLEGLWLPALINFHHPNAQSISTAANMDSSATRSLEDEALDIEDTIKAILFGHIDPARQRLYSFQHVDWQSLSVKKLYSGMRIRCRAMLASREKERAKREADLQPCLVAQDKHHGEMTENNGLQSKEPMKGLRWQHQDRTLWPDGSAAVTTSRQDLWSDGSLGLASYQRAEAAS